MKKSIFLLSILYYLYGCNKNDEVVRTYVQGTVISFYDSSIVVPFATVYLHRGQDNIKIDSVKTNSQGQFRIDFSPDKNTMYGVTAKQAKYFESSKTYFYNNTTFPNFDKVKIRAYSKSYIRVRIKDETRNERYSGVRLNHTAFSRFNLIYGYPLVDTTIIVEGYFENQYFGWGFLYPDNIWGSEKVIKFNTPTPLDTFDVVIKF